VANSTAADSFAWVNGGDAARHHALASTSAFAAGAVSLLELYRLLMVLPISA